MTASLVAIVGLAGCGEDAGSSAGTPETPEPSRSSTGSPTASPTDDSPTDEASPSVRPAAGPRVALETVTFNLPEGWRRAPTSARIGGGTATGGSTITMLDFPGSSFSLDQLARDTIRQSRDGHGIQADLSRKPDVEVDGCTAFRVEGPGAGDRKDVHDVFVGCKRDDHDYTLGFSLAAMPAAERAELVDSVLASWRFR